MFRARRFTAAANAVHTARTFSSTTTAANSRPEDADDSNRAGTHVIEHPVDGLADHMRFAAASRAGGNPSDAVREKDASDIQIGFRC
jgi:hypothetical protein